MKSTKRINAANGPVRLDRIAEALLDPVVSKAGFTSTQLIAAWSNIVGPELAERSRPERLRWPARRDETASETAARASGATLIVRAEGGDALEVQYLSGHIIARINAIFGWRAVDRITVRQGPVGKTVDTRQEQSSPNHGARVSSDKSTRDARLAGVEDAELRDALARLGEQVGAEGYADKDASEDADKDRGEDTIV